MPLCVVPPTTRLLRHVNNKRFVDFAKVSFILAPDKITISLLISYYCGYKRKCSAFGIEIRLSQPLVVFFWGKCASRIALLVPSHPLYICQCSFILIRSERSDYAIRHSTGKCIWVSNIIEFYRIYRSSIYHSPLSSNGNNFWQEENLLIPINVTRKYLTMSYWLIPSAMWVQPLFVTKIYILSSPTVDASWHSPSWANLICISPFIWLDSGKWLNSLPFFISY